MHCLITYALAVVALGTWQGAIVAAEAAAPFPLPTPPRLLPTAHSTSCPTLYYTTDVEREARTLRSLREPNRAYVVGGASRRRRQAAAAGNVLRPAA